MGRMGEAWNDSAGSTRRTHVIEKEQFAQQVSMNYRGSSSTYRVSNGECRESSVGCRRNVCRNQSNAVQLGTCTIASAKNSKHDV